MNCEEFQWSAREYYRQAVEEVKAYERVILDKKNQIKKQWGKVFQISRTPQCEEATFDMEGDDDILNLSFRGEHVDIQRSKLTKSNLGWNLFSCLFKKHWDGFHVRDKEGRIYIDLKYDGFKSLLNGLSRSRNVSISNNYTVYHSLNSFNMLNVQYDARKPLVGLENSQFYSQLSGLKGIQIALGNSYYRHTQMRFVLLDSFNFLDAGDLERPISSHDLRYKSLFLLAKVRNGPLVGIIHHLHLLPVSRLTDTHPVSIFHLPLDNETFILHWSALAALKSSNIPSDLTDLFPLQFLKASHYQNGGSPNFEIQRNGKGKYVHNLRTVSGTPSHTRYAIDSCQFETLEIYEMQRRYLPETLKLPYKQFILLQIPSFSLKILTSAQPREQKPTRVIEPSLGSQNIVK
jgi:hypothetical protein